MRILYDDSLLRRLTRFAGLFFASSAPIVDGGAGDGGDGDGGSGGGGDQGGAGDEGAGEGEEGHEGEEGDEQEVEGEESDEDLDPDEEDDDELGDEDEDEEGGAQRKSQRAATEKKVKAALNELRKTNAEAAKTLTKEFFSQGQTIRSYERSFRSPVMAAAAADLITRSGGETGITSAFNDARTFAKEITQLGSGDPGLITELAKSSPRGLVKITPHAVAAMRRVDGAAFDTMAAGIVAEMFDSKGITHAVERMWELLGDGKVDGAKALVKNMYDWIEATKGIAAKKPSDAGGDEGLSDERKAIDSEKAQIFRTKVNEVTASNMSAAIDKRLKPYLRDRIKSNNPLKKSQRADLQKGIYDRISAKLKIDAEYQETVGSLLEEGNLAAVNRYVMQKFNGLVKKAARAEWHSRGFAAGGKSRRPGAGGGSGKGDRAGAGGSGGSGGGSATATFGSKPAASDINWDAPRARDRFQGVRNGSGQLIGEATLKNGKVVKWDWNKV